MTGKTISIDDIKNADKLLNASSRVYARETVVKYAIIHRQHQRLPGHFLKEERTT